jgi:protein-S-isoprenylcysteine O-methyltransferase Ste14
LIASIVLAFRLMNPVGGAVGRTGLLSPAHAAALTFVILVALSLTCAWVLSLRSGKPSGGKGWPRAAGSLIVFLEAALLISAVLLVLRVTGIPSAATRANSLLYRGAVNLLPMMFDSLKEVLPAEQEIEEEFEGNRIRGL